MFKRITAVLLAVLMSVSIGQMEAASVSWTYVINGVEVTKEEYYAVAKEKNLIMDSSENPDFWINTQGILHEYSGKGGDVVIPDGVTRIGDMVFYRNNAITSVVIPESVTSIAQWAFKECKNLKSVTLPSTLEEIGNLAFQSCTSLTSIAIPDSVKTIGEKAFEKCSALVNITLPDTPVSYGIDVFSWTSWDAGASGKVSFEIKEIIQTKDGRLFSSQPSVRTENEFGDVSAYYFPAGTVLAYESHEINEGDLTLIHLYEPIINPFAPQYKTDALKNATFTQNVLNDYNESNIVTSGYEIQLTEEMTDVVFYITHDMAGNNAKDRLAFRGSVYDSDKVDPGTESFYTDEELTELAAAKYKQMCEDILALIISDGMSTDDKIKAIYDFLIYNFLHIRFYDPGYKQTHKEKDNNKRLEYSMPLTKTDLQYLDINYTYLFEHGEGVCDHFAMTFSYFLGLLGIQSYYVSGYFIDTQGERTGHMWNYVNVDGAWYWYDVDVEGTVYRTGDRDEPSYYLYKRDTEFFRTNHVWDEEALAEDVLAWTLSRSENAAANQEMAIASEITVLYNGVKIEFTQPPTERNGYVFYPLEDVLATFSGGHGWDGGTFTVSGELNENKVEIPLQSLAYWVNGKLLETAPELMPFIANERTYVYLDIIVEGLGLTVNWDGDTKTINITN
ncbi:MAG: leucine-rich repeat protein [Clostridiales bacterium]|jgi:hypothetical protein|nr:leucine-rich repeat protein [Clostridiales bacterium]